MNGGTSYVFRVERMDADALKPQASAALERWTEAVSREKLPRMWRVTDRLNAAARPTRGRKMRSAVLLALGIFLLVPGLASPRELPIALAAGAVGAAAGAWGLLRREGPGRVAGRRFDAAAATLIERQNAALGDETACVRFDARGMEIEGAVTPYADMKGVVETQDTLLAVFGDRCVLLTKAGLESGSVEELRRALEGKTRWYAARPGAV